MKIFLDQPLALEVTGLDAAKILHNLTTNQMQQLDIGKSLETFVTDVRGWTVAHGLIYHAELDRWLLLGQHPNPAGVCTHIDRYIIREQAAVKDLSSLARLELEYNTDGQTNPGSSTTTSVPQGNSSTFQVDFAAFGPQAKLRVQLSIQPHASDWARTSSEAWELLRIAHFWPRMGVDIWDKCIPQELDRTAQAISFTKGCYLGQETIARLDARGQIQKKLCLLKMDGRAQPGAKLLLNDQSVGHLTSVATIDTFSLALAVLRRGYFDRDTRLTCDGIAAQVIDTDTACSYLSHPKN